MCRENRENSPEHLTDRVPCLTYKTGCIPTLWGAAILTVGCMVLSNGVHLHQYLSPFPADTVGSEYAQVMIHLRVAFCVRDGGFPTAKARLVGSSENLPTSLYCYTGFRAASAAAESEPALPNDYNLNRKMQSFKK